MEINKTQLDLLREIAEEILQSDSFHPSLRRELPAVGSDGRTVYTQFYKNGTRSAILVAMLQAIALGGDPVASVLKDGIFDATGMTTTPQSGEDPITAAALAGAPAPTKPDFNTLKKPQPVQNATAHIMQVETAAGKFEVKPGETANIPLIPGEKRAPIPAGTFGSTEADAQKPGLNDDIGREESALFTKGEDTAEVMKRGRKPISQRIEKVEATVKEAKKKDGK